MKHIFILAALLFVSAATIAQKPMSDAEYRLVSENFTINEDGSTDFNFRRELTLHANRAMTAYATNGETFIVYNPINEVLIINESYTLLPNGDTVFTPKNAFIEQLPENCADCARYSNMKEMVVVHTGLELECTIVLDYTIRRNSHDVIGKIYFANDYPIQKYQFKMSAPEKYGYLIQPLNLDRIQYTTHGDKGQFELTAFDIPAKLKDSYLPSDDELYPQIYISSIQEDEYLMFANGTTEDTYIEWGRKITDAEPLLESLKGYDAKTTITNIRNWVVDNVKRVSISANLDPYAIDENLAWKENCGLNSSRIPLVAALIQKAGYKAQIEWGMYKMPEVNGTRYIQPRPNESRIIVTIDGAQYILNPTEKTPLSQPSIPDVDDDTIISISQQLEWEPISMDNGFHSITIPTHDKGLHLNLALLTSLRTNPLKCHPTSEQYHYTLTMPDGVRMVSKPVSKEYSFPGIGSVKVVIKRNGNTIDIDRRLVVENGNISVEQYQNFRQLISTWETTNKLIFKL